MMKGIKWGANVSDFPDMVLMGAVDGVKKITAGNYGGSLGKIEIQLRDVLKS